ncbi:hypothetical protein Tco_0795651 [Tanacetum coccineum]
MGTCVNQRKKFFAEERPKLKRNKPHDPIQLKTYMMNDLKNQGSIELKSAEELSLKTTKDSLKRFGEELQTKTPKRLKEDKDDEAKDDEPTKKLGKRRKQIARKATYKIIKQGEKGVYQIVREDGTDIVYINFGAMLKSISRDDLTELYRIVMNRYGLDGPEDKLEKGFLEIKYPLPAEVCKTMLKMKLLDGKMNEDCYRLLKMMEKQAGIRKVDMVLNPPWNLPFLGAKGLTSPEQTATGKGISNPFVEQDGQKPYGIQLTNVSRVNTPGSDENRMKLYDLMYNIVNIAEESLKTSCCQDLKT